MQNANKSSVLDQGKIIESTYWDHIHHPLIERYLSGPNQCNISKERDGYGNCFEVKEAIIAGRPLSRVS